MSLLGQNMTDLRQKPPDGFGFVYGLIDPRYGIVRYVGKTIKPLSKRWKEHLGTARCGVYRTRWINKLKSLEVQPYPIALVVLPVEELNEAEIRFIAACRVECEDAGHPLTNGTDGGDGGNGFQGHKHTPEMCAWFSKIAKLRPKHKMPKTPEWQAKITAKLRGRKPTPEQIRKTAEKNRGQKRSPEVRAKMGAWLRDDAYRAKLSAALKGRVISPEARAKTSAALTGRCLSEETKRKIGLASHRNQLGKPHPHKGTPHTDEAKAHNSAAQMGKKMPAEWVAYMRRAFVGARNPFYGRKHTEETRKRISEIRKGKPGHKQTEASKAKMRAAMLGKNKGKKRTPEQCAAMSAARTGANNPMFGKKRTCSPETRAKISAAFAARRAAKALEVAS